MAALRTSACVVANFASATFGVRKDRQKQRKRARDEWSRSAGPAPRKRLSAAAETRDGLAGCHQATPRNRGAQVGYGQRSARPVASDDRDDPRVARNCGAPDGA